MSRYQMSEAVRAFLTQSITSVAQLDLLLLLRTTRPRRWRVRELAGELRVEESWIAQQLEAFTRSGLAACEANAPDTSWYQPVTDATEQIVAQVAQEYLLHRVSVIEFIYSRPDETLKAFADAFRLRKDKEPPRG